MGVVCFEALTGAAPFEAGSLLELMTLHTTADRPKVSETWRPLGTVFDEAIIAMMAVDPLERPATAETAFDLLEAAWEKWGANPERGMVTPIDWKSETAVLGTPGFEAANIRESQQTAVMRDRKGTQPWAGHPAAAATTGDPAPARKKELTTLGATSSGIMDPLAKKSKKKLLLLAGAAVLLLLLGLIVSFAGGESTVDPDSAASNSPPAASLASEPTSVVSVEPPVASVSTSATAPAPSSAPEAPPASAAPKPTPAARPHSATP